MEFFRANIIPGELIVQIIAFILVFLFMKKFAWKPLLETMEDRRERIRKELADIEQAKKDIETLKAEYAVRLQGIEDTARAKVQEALDEGRRVSREIQEKARQESQAAFEKGKENLAMEIVKARTELRREIANLAVDVAERVLDEKLSDDKKQSEKILEIILHLEKNL